MTSWLFSSAETETADAVKGKLIVNAADKMVPVNARPIACHGNWPFSANTEGGTRCWAGLDPLNGGAALQHEAATRYNLLGVDALMGVRVWSRLRYKFWWQ